MPSVLQKARKQTAVYWAPSADGFDASGTPVTVTAGVDVACRWQDQKKEIIMPDQTVFNQSAVVHPATEVERGGFMVEGTIATVADVNDHVASGAQEIVLTNATPNFRNDETNFKISVGQWHRV